MNESLEAWIAECIGKGTFASREDAIEFCVGATRVFCERMDLNQSIIKAANEDPERRDYNIVKLRISFPLKWSEDFEKRLKDTGRRDAPPPIPPPPPSNRLKFWGKRCPICGWRRKRSLFMSGTTKCCFCYSRERLSEIK